MQQAHKYTYKYNLHELIFVKKRLKNEEMDIGKKIIWEYKDFSK